MAAPPAAPTRPLAAHTCARRRPRAPPPSLARAPNWLRTVPGGGGGSRAGHTDCAPGPTDRPTARSRSALRERLSRFAACRCASAGPETARRPPGRRGRGQPRLLNNCGIRLRRGRGGPRARLKSWLGHPGGRPASPPAPGARGPGALAAPEASVPLGGWGEEWGLRGPTPGVSPRRQPPPRRSVDLGPASLRRSARGLLSCLGVSLAQGLRPSVPSRPCPFCVVKLGPGLESPPGAGPAAPRVAH